MASKGDDVPKFTFKEISGLTGGTEANSNTGVVTMEVTSSVGNKAHEVSHGWDLSPRGIHEKDPTDREEGTETRAYQAQYAIDHLDN